MTAKILGLGLSKTGTTSLAESLRRLGYSTGHFKNHAADERGVKTWFRGDFADDCLENYDAAIDLPIPIFYRQLDSRYPGSKFILTKRPLADWLDSLRAHWNRFSGTDTRREYRRLVRERMYGGQEFCEDRLSRVFESHHAGVDAYFENRPDDLLVMDVCAGDGWGELCAFLGRSLDGSLLQLPFPHLNKSSQRNST